MKKKPELQDDDDHRHLEILKAVAQAWHSHTGSSKPASEFDAHRRNSRPTPSRFKLEAIRTRSSVSDRRWDFGQSLWDSYEIVTVSKKLEAGLVLDRDGFREVDGGGGRSQRKKRESCNSLRNLFSRASSRRFNY
ncbi:uncharacterized protein LOC120082919 [Benincasa hispida]|uniref:uncharacterized protein LOC120082919 n=1 Tax=Benincasa hispida TaxID=102211 RepID=UPI001902A7DE|nr:uncharacterized protein LOC120082919 [Benincasa hispida]